MPGLAALADVHCLVVHHHNHPEVLGTLASLVAAGVLPEQLVVVDNSQDDALLARLVADLPAGVRCLNVANRGYAAAVNQGVAFIADTMDGDGFVLVCTHEVRVARDCVRRLREVMVADRGIAVAGPRLLLERGPDGTSSTWSRGGELSPVLRIPRHRRRPEAGFSGPRQWLDGAVLLYRLDALLRTPLPEKYFLYFEEVDHHQHLRSLGATVMYVDQATATQRPRGIPAELHGRNLGLFLDRHGRPGLRTVAVHLVGLRLLAGAVLRRRSWQQVGQYYAGMGNPDRNGHG